MIQFRLPFSGKKVYLKWNKKLNKAIEIVKIKMVCLLEKKRNIKQNTKENYEIIF